MRITVKKLYNKYKISELDAYNIAEYFIKKMKIKKKIAFIFDFELYRLTREANKYSLSNPNDWAGSEFDTQIIWLNLKRHQKAKDTWELYNSIVHELLHNTHPMWSENRVKKETERLLKRWNIYRL